MKDKLKAHFLAFGPRRFVIFATLSLILTDLLNSYYLKLYWEKKDLSTQMVHKSVERSGMSVQEFDLATLNEMVGFMNNLFSFFLLIIIVNNVFFYFFYLRKRLWAQGFVLFYTLTAALLSLTLIVDDAGLGTGWKAYNALTIPYYLYLYFGVKLLKNETTLAHGKKGR